MRFGGEQRVASIHQHDLFFSALEADKHERLNGTSIAESSRAIPALSLAGPAESIYVNLWRWRGMTSGSAVATYGPF
jgi:hypothetical protein